MIIYLIFLLLLSFNNIISHNHNCIICNNCNIPKRENFQAEIDGKKVDLYFLSNSNCYEIAITNYGGIIVSILAPNLKDQVDNIIQGYSTLQEYIDNQKKGKKVNSVLGRYANAIKDGEFIIDNKKYKLSDLNNYSNFGEKVWTPVQINNNELRLYYTSPDGENGFPGDLHLEVVYTLNDNNEFKISFAGTTNKKTVVNISQRLFFNLEGNQNNNINNHLLVLNSKLYLPVDDNKIPLGDIKSLENTSNDFRQGQKIGEKNIENYFILNKKNNKKLAVAGSLEEEKNGRNLVIYTTEPGVNVISDKFGISIEPMHFPNSPNVGFFPSTILKPGKIYKQETIYKFDLRMK